MTDISGDELVGLPEFALLPENAEQAGVTGPLPAVHRVDMGAISALQWGDSAPRVVFFHGGGQNAHTWDTVIVGFGQPALAMDLPGHGHSAWRDDGDYSPQNNAAALAPVLSARRATSSTMLYVSGSSEAEYITLPSMSLTRPGTTASRSTRS